MVWFIENKVCNHLPNSSFQQTVVWRVTTTQIPLQWSLI